MQGQAANHAQISYSKNTASGLWRRSLSRKRGKDSEGFGEYASISGNTIGANTRSLHKPLLSALPVGPILPELLGLGALRGGTFGAMAQSRRGGHISPQSTPHLAEGEKKRSEAGERRRRYVRLWCIPSITTQHKRWWRLYKSDCRISMKCPKKKTLRISIRSIDL